MLKIKRRYRYFLLILLPFFAVGNIAWAAENAQVDGAWQFTIEDSGRVFTPIFILEQNGRAITGIYRNSQGDNPANGTVQENDITLNAEITGRDGAKRIVTYIGTVNGNTMTGSMKSSRGDVPFTATRKE